MTKLFLVTSGILGAAAVALGAYGAHGLEAAIGDAPDALRRLELWRTAVSYHLPHAVMLTACAWVASQKASRRVAVAGAAFVLGIALFCGTLYAMSLGAPRWLGAVTPLGGLSLIVGWLVLASTAFGANAIGTGD